MKGDRVQLPFLVNMRVSGDSFQEELGKQIKLMADFYGRPVEDFRAVVELVPDPEVKNGMRTVEDEDGLAIEVIAATHFLSAYVEYRGAEPLSPKR